jgi:hypothetical protein
MLSGLSKDVAECYRRAAECLELAKLANEKDKRFYLEREKDWLNLARAYQFQEGLELVIDDSKRRRGVTETRPCPTCKMATPVRYAMVFVCTNCRLVFEDQ